MLRPLMLLLALLIVSISATAQIFWVPKTPLFEFLYQLKKPVSEISNTDDQQFLPIQFYKIGTKQKIIKNNNGLFILIDGSGQVYKATSVIENKIAFTRVDSTIFLGNSFNSFNFSYKDTIFNLGGYGFWRANGLLSYFKEGNEWTVVRINKEYQALDVIHNYLPDNSKLFYAQIPIKEEFTYNKLPEPPLVLQLDLNKKENTVLGQLSKEFDFPNTVFKVNINSLQGVLVAYRRDFLLLNFEKNVLYKMTNTKLIDQLSNNNHNLIKNTFEIGNKLYYTLEPDHTLHSVEISMNDFKLEPYQLYIPIKSQQNNLLISVSISLVVVLMLLCFIGFKKWRKNKASISPEGFVNPVLNSLDNTLAFSSLEHELILQIILKSKSGNLFTVDEMNTGLGLGRKSIEIQKKIRTESINRINHKFKINFSQDVDLIDRVRSEEDRRYFQYTISEINASIFKNEIDK